MVKVHVFLALDGRYLLTVATFTLAAPLEPIC